MYTREELESAGLLDFRVFLCHVWDYLGLPAPTPAQLDMAYWLQHAPQKVILSAFRGIGKSFITVAFVLWVLLLDPQKKIMVVSANDNLASDFTIFCKQLILGMPVLQHLVPRVGQRDKMEVFDVGPATPDKNPSVKSVGITGQLTGSRADIIVSDDVEVPKNSYTFVQRERLSALVKEYAAILKPLDESRVIVLGTPQHEESLYVKMEQRGYQCRVWPVQIPSDPDKYRGRLAPFVLKMIAKGAQAGDPVDPIRFNKDIIASKRLEYGAAGFDLQFMLDTSHSDSELHPLKLNDLIVHDCDDQMGHVQLVWGGASNLVIQDLPAGGLEGDAYHRPAWSSPEMTKYQSTVMAIDPSGQGKDETGFAIVKYLNGLLYLVDVGGFVDGFAELTMRLLAGKALRWNVNNIIIETNYGGGMFNQLLKPHLIRVFGEKTEQDTGTRKLGSAGRIDEEWNGWSSTQKELRILDTLEPIVQNHRLVVSRRVIEEDLKQQQEKERYSFVQQFTRMARIKGCLPNEDRLECLSMACQYFLEKMNRDADRARQQHKDAEMAKELKDWAKHVFNVKGGANEFLVRQ